MFNTSLRHVSFSILEEMLALHQFVRKVIRLKGQTTDQFQFSLSFQGSLKN